MASAYGCADDLGRDRLVQLDDDELGSHLLSGANNRMHCKRLRRVERKTNSFGFERKLKPPAAATELGQCVQSGLADAKLHFLNLSRFQEKT
jgi:hypothetical protein